MMANEFKNKKLDVFEEIHAQSSAGSNRRIYIYILVIDKKLKVV